MMRNFIFNFKLVSFYIGVKLNRRKEKIQLDLIEVLRINCESSDRNKINEFRSKLVSSFLLWQGKNIKILNKESYVLLEYIYMKV